MNKNTFFIVITLLLSSIVTLLHAAEEQGTKRTFSDSQIMLLEKVRNKIEPKKKKQKSSSGSDIRTFLTGYVPKEREKGDSFYAKYKDSKGGTLSMAAVEHVCASEDIEKLLQIDDVNAQDSEGNTALHRALAGTKKKQGSNKKAIDYTVVSKLLNQGANVNIENNQGITPLKLAQQKNAHSIIAKMKQFAATEAND